MVLKSLTTEKKKYKDFNMLFPGVTYQKNDGWGANCAKWMRGYVRDVGIEDSNKVLYSMRHTVVLRLDELV